MEDTANVGERVAFKCQPGGLVSGCLDGIIGRLRVALVGTPFYIQTVYGYGYQLRDDRKSRRPELDGKARSTAKLALSTEDCVAAVETHGSIARAARVLGISTTSVGERYREYQRAAELRIKREASSFTHG